MTTKPSDPSDVYAGSNTTGVTISWKAACSIPDEVAVVFDLYIGDPTMAMVPGTTLGTLAALTSVSINPGQTVTTSVGPWDSSTIPHLSQPHHACMLAR